MAVEAPPASEPGGQSLPAAGFLLLGALSLIWGLNWPFMKIALTEIPVWPFRGMCLLGGGMGLLAMTAASGRSLRVSASEIRPLLICTLFNVVGWHLLSGYGVSLMAAGRASIVAFTMPVWAALFSAPVLGERTNWRHWLGLGLGMAGLGVLIGPDVGTLGAAPWGAACMLSAAVSWGFGTVLIKRYTWAMPTGALSGWQLLLGAVPIALGALLIDTLPDPAAIGPAAWLSMAYILAGPMIFCHWAWFKVISLFPAVLAAIGLLAIPAVGVLSGGLILGEPVGLREISALALVCAALVAVLVLPALRQGLRRRPL